MLSGAVTCGLSAGLFWASADAVALGYFESGKRRRCMKIWLWFRTGGPALGGAMVLALNNDAGARTKGKVGYRLDVSRLHRLAVPGCTHRAFTLSA